MKRSASMVENHWSKTASRTATGFDVLHICIKRELC